MKIVTVVGARPQFVKASVVSHEIKQSNDVSEVLIHTGQHFDTNMSDVFFTELGMSSPDYFLGINGGTHGEMTGRMLEQLEKVLLVEKPNVVLLYGDTNSTLAGALAASKLHIPVAHVEAGLRSFNMSMPEEVNRLITDRVSRWLFTPTATASENLRKEGYSENNIVEVGDVMYDVALHHGSRVKSGNGLMKRLDIASNNYVLVTIHRAENTNDPKRLAAIVDGLITVSKTVPVVWPLHPRTREYLKNSGWLEKITKRITVIDPVSYLEMIQLEKFAAVIATDSGGVQKEAFFYKVPCVTLRDETEWTELLEMGWNQLVPTVDPVVISESILNAIGSCGMDKNPYGIGDAAKKIVGIFRAVSN